MVASVVRLKSAVHKSVRDVYHHLRFQRDKVLWYAINPHNETKIGTAFHRDHVSVGAWTYGRLNVIDAGGHSQLFIGCFCSIAEGVTFVLNGEHPLDTLTTFPVGVFVGREESSALSRGDISIGDDVWIGQGAVILSGVTVGRGSVIGAGAVVAGDIPEFAIAVGSPARVIRYRFDEELRKRISHVDLTLLTKSFILSHLDALENSCGPDLLETLERRQGRQE